MDNGTPHEPNEDVGNDPAPPQADDGNDAAEGAGEDGQAVAPQVPPPTAEKKWYIVHTYSGHENKAKLTLLERVKTHNLTEYFGDVLVPTESVTENV